MTSSFNNFVIERAILAVPYASYNKGSKGTGGAFDLPMQVTINVNTGDMQLYSTVTLPSSYSV